MGDNYPGKYLTSRYANYVRLREKASGNEILVYDIHPRAGNDVETQKPSLCRCLTWRSQPNCRA